jgi:hypothetical protein
MPVGLEMPIVKRGLSRKSFAGDSVFQPPHYRTLPTPLPSRTWRTECVFRQIVNTVDDYLSRFA